MKIHEYQGKQLLKDFGVAIPQSQVAFTPAEAEAAMASLGAEEVVVKAQVHTGGRGKAGGIKFAQSPKEARDIAQKLIGTQLVTKQTGPSGEEIIGVLVEEASQIGHEYYLSLILDRAKSCVTIMASSAGGMNIEEVAAKAPEQLFQEPIDPLLGVADFQVNRLGRRLGFNQEQLKDFGKILRHLYDLFLAKDASMIEINPLVTTEDGDLLALDAKFNFDENALYRHPELLDWHQKDQSPVARKAQEFGLSYIPLEGNIGCMVNGAGLAMATMDIIKYFGGEPANFLDAGGSATPEAVELAFEIILKDEHVKAIFINIFGGIMQCDTIARGIVQAMDKLGTKLPVVVRLDGAKAKEAREILAQSDIDVISVAALDEGAKRVVEEAKKAEVKA